MYYETRRSWAIGYRHTAPYSYAHTHTWTGRWLRWCARTGSVIQMDVCVGLCDKVNFPIYFTITCINSCSVSGPVFEEKSDCYSSLLLKIVWFHIFYACLCYNLSPNVNLSLFFAIFRLHFCVDSLCDRLSLQDAVLSSGAPSQRYLTGQLYYITFKLERHVAVLFTQRTTVSPHIFVCRSVPVLWT